MKNPPAATPQPATRPRLNLSQRRPVPHDLNQWTEGNEALTTPDAELERWNQLQAELLRTLQPAARRHPWIPADSPWRTFDRWAQVAELVLAAIAIAATLYAAAHWAAT